MPTNASRYLASYQRAVYYSQAADQIRQDIANEQDRADQLEALAIEQQALLADLEERFATPPQDLSEIGALLKSENARVQGDNAARSAASSANRLSAEEENKIKNAPDFEVRELLNNIREGGYNQAQARKALELARARFGSEVEGKLGNSYIALNNSIGTLPPPARAPGEAQESKDARQIALDRLFLSAPEAAFGGKEAQAILEARKSAPLASSRFATEEDILTGYLELLEDGTVTAEEWAAANGYTDPAEAKADYQLAVTVYNRAKAERSFRNDQRKYFEPAWLDQAARAASAQAQAVEARSKTSYNPQQEQLKRELAARGIDVEDKYFRYKGTPVYGYMTTADRIYDQVKGDVRAATPTQVQVARFVDMSRQNGKFNVASLEGQLKKMNLSPSQQQEAVGFALAYARSRDEAALPPDQRALQEESDKQKALEEAQKKSAAAEAAALAAEEERKKNEMSAELTQRARVGEDAAAYYRALRSSGYNPDEARAKTDEFFPEFGRPTPGGPLDLRGAEREADQLLRAQFEEAAQAGRPVTPPPDDAMRKMFIERWVNKNLPEDTAGSQAPLSLSAPVLPSAGGEPGVQPVTPEQVQAQFIADPTNPSFAYRKRRDGGYDILQDGGAISPAMPGSTAARSIDSVLSGGQPIRPAPRRPAATSAAPQTSSSANPEDNVPLVPVQIGGQTVMVPSSATPPPAATRRMRYDPVTDQMVEVP